ncbi:hypothetical protein WJX74_010127 [Apatococcus lobatus]|uniref:Uncharacterized protein n=1 Tax=Apatococcus lobatus TaxID=904363 RepID=A0AAW1RW88_9CHLO
MRAAGFFVWACTTCWLVETVRSLPQLNEKARHLTRSDLLVTFGTTSTEDRLDFVKASRGWRKGTRAVIVVDKEVPAAVASDAWKHHEAYLVHPDRDPAKGHFSQFSGDAHAAIAPLLAHQQLESGSGHPAEEYKWILLGDDDTLWFMGGVLKLLQTFDHNLPYAVTDEMFWHTWGDPAAERFHEDGPPRCLPCHFNASAYKTDPAALFTPPVGCPCTPDVICSADKRGILNEACDYPGVMDNPRAGPLYSVDGGAGVLLSVGLMRALDLEAMQHCITTSHGSASDHIFTYCLWQQGYAITLPNSAAMPTGAAQEHLFSPRDNTNGQTHNTENKRGDIMTKLLWSAEGSPHCNASCETSLLSMVSLHVRSRGLRNLHAASLLIKSLSELYHTFLAGMGPQLQDQPT